MPSGVLEKWEKSSDLPKNRRFVNGTSIPHEWSASRVLCGLRRATALGKSSICAINRPG
jgi:hypothetical protein